MSKKGRIIILITCVCLSVVMAVTALVVVLTSSTTTFNSNVNIEYNAEDNVAVRVSASYKIGNVTTLFTSNGNNYIDITPTNRTGSLNPPATITFDSNNSRVVFQYTFSNLSDMVEAGISLSQEITATNLKTRYAYSDTAINDYTYFDDELNLSLDYTAQLLSAGSDKYIYIIVEVEDIMQDATYSNTITWNLTRETGVTITYNTTGVTRVVNGSGNTITLAIPSAQSGITTNSIAGTTYSNIDKVIKNGKAIEPSFYPETNNKMFIGWTTTSGGDVPIDFSTYTFSSDTTLYPAYKTGTLDPSILVLNNNEYQINYSENYTYDESENLTSEPSTTISSIKSACVVDGEFVIPDIYNGLPITSNNFNYMTYHVYTDHTVELNRCLLSSASNVYIGNYFQRFDYVFYGEYLGWGIDQYTQADNIVLGRNCLNKEGIYYSDFLANGWHLNSWALINKNLNSIRVMKGNPYYDSRNNCNCVLDSKTNLIVKTSNNSVVPDSSKGVDINGYTGNTTITSIVIPEGTTKIPTNAFKNCTALTSVTLPSTLLEIGNEAFYGCTSLTNMTFPASLKLVKSYAFKNCTSLATVTFTKGADLSIENYAFEGCTSLSTVNIPSSIYSIGKDVFPTVFLGNNINTAIPCSDDTSKYWFVQSSSAITNTSAIANWDNVVAIAGSAFYNNSSLTTATIPSGVRCLGEYTFYKCTALNSLTMNSIVDYIGQYCFQSCSVMTGLSLPTTLKYIGLYAFDGCSAITNISIPNVTTLGAYAFRNCTNLKSVTLCENLSELPDYVFSGCTALITINIPNNLKTFGSYSLDGTAITSLTIPEGVTSIELYAFRNTTNLTSLYLNAIKLQDLSSAANLFYSSGTNGSGFKIYVGPRVTRIPNYFMYARSNSTAAKVTGIVIPDDNVLMEFGDNCFQRVLGSFSIELNHSINKIGTGAFRYSGIANFNIYGNILAGQPYMFANTNNLTEVNIYGNVYGLSSYLFSRSSVSSIKIAGTISGSTKSVSNYFCQNATNLTSIVLPSNVTSIGGYAFNGCTSLERIVLPNSITSIGIYAFDGATSLVNVNMPTSLTTISDYAFRNTALTSVNIIDSVTTVGKYAFANCSNLTSVKVGSGCKSLGAYIFDGCSGFKVEMSVTSGWFTATSATATSGTSVTFTSDTTANATVFTSNNTSFINRT